MGRLIDADKLKHAIHCAYSDDLEILEKIDEQPTAFDMDEVVKQLEKEKEIDFEPSDIANVIWNDAIQRAIKIVKGCVVE